DEKRCNRLDELVERVLAAANEIAVVEILENEAGGKRPDNGCEADGRRQPRKRKAKSQPRRQQHATCLQLRGNRKELRREIDPQHQRTEEKDRRFREDESDRAVRQRSTSISRRDDPGNDR